MMFDMKGARDANTVDVWTNTIWRVFLNNKLFISDAGETCFNTRELAEKAVNESTWMKKVNEYADHSQNFFKKNGDDQWRAEFIDKIKKNLNLKFERYSRDGN